MSKRLKVNQSPDTTRGNSKWNPIAIERELRRFASHSRSDRNMYLLFLAMYGLTAAWIVGGLVWLVLK